MIRQLILLSKLWLLTLYLFYFERFLPESDTSEKRPKF